jgi:hypothetical protein
VRIRYTAERVEIEVAGARRAAADGIAALRERVEFFGGRLRAGGSLIHAELPTTPW